MPLDLSRIITEEDFARFSNMFKEVDRYDWKERCSYCQSELEMSNGHGRCPRCGGCVSCGD